MAAPVLPGSDGIGTGRPNTARVWDYLADGKNAFAADREMAEDLLDPDGGYPGLRELARDSRRFTAKAVTWLSMPGIRLSAHGIRQFIDAGCGFPGRPPVHETAQAGLGPAKVAYVDSDPLVLSHLKAMRDAGPGVAVVDGDLSDPRAVLKDPALTGVIDPGQPAAVLLTAVLHYFSADAAREITAGWAEMLAPGSALVISVLRFADEDLAGRMRRRYTAGTLFNHGPGDVGSFFAGLRIPQGQAAGLRNWPLPGGSQDGGASMTGGIGLKG